MRKLFKVFSGLERFFGCEKGFRAKVENLSVQNNPWARSGLLLLATQVPSSRCFVRPDQYRV